MQFSELIRMFSYIWCIECVLIGLETVLLKVWRGAGERGNEAGGTVQLFPARPPQSLTADATWQANVAPFDGSQLFLFSVPSVRRCAQVIPGQDHQRSNASLQLYLILHPFLRLLHHGNTLTFSLQVYTLHRHKPSLFVPMFACLCWRKTRSSQS